ncbi:MAG: TonB-dependent receptor [Bacteroidaceae bacterium]|nr:TonB-dependent receptor [Bacteroidaceae bacterium]
MTCRPYHLLICLLLPATVQGEEALVDTTRELHAVEVAVQRYTAPLRSRADGVRQWQMSSLQAMPHIAGNTDPLHVAEMLPGVQTTGEYDAGLHIWGCDNAHNEVAIDGATLYGVQHLLGFFSIFNASHFPTMTFAPAASLASSSNRLGGLLRMESIDAPLTHTTGELSVGPLSSQATLRLPLGGRTAVVVSAREAYMNLLYSRWMRMDGEQMGYSFGDYNVTLLHEFSERDRLRVNAYAGHDRATLGAGLYLAEGLMRWGNQMVSADHRHTFRDSLQLTQSASFSRYGSRFSLSQEELDLAMEASIADLSYHGSLLWHSWRAGADASVLWVQPQNPDLHLTGRHTYEGEPRQRVQQYTLYVERPWVLAQGLTLRPTLRGTLYVDDLQQIHLLPSPSVSAEWRTARAGTFTLHYAWQHQPLFQTGMTTSGMPTEFWLAAGRYSQPQSAQHISLSHEVTMGRGRWGLSAAVYYKRLRNQLEYQGTVLDFLNTRYTLEHSLLRGDGYSYGVNVMLLRRTGPVTGWVSYAYTRSRRTVSHPSFSDSHPSSHERPHEVNAVLTWRINPHWSLGATYVFCSGTPFTPLRHLYLINHTLLVEQGALNSYRLKPYQRLDLSVSYDIRHTERMECGVNLSLYNATCQQNELFYHLRSYNGHFSYRPRGFLLPLLPSVNFYMRWK